MIVKPSAMQRVATEVAASPEKPPTKLQLHAPDAPGVAAFEAAQFASAVAFNLQVARSPTLSREVRMEAIERVFTAWPAMCRTMAALETAAPRSSAVGLENAAKLRDMADTAERRRNPGIDQ